MIMTERVELVWSVTRKSKGVNYQQGFKLHHEPCLIKIGDPASAILNLSVSPPQKLPVKQSRFTKHSPSLRLYGGREEVVGSFRMFSSEKKVYIFD